MSNRETVDAWEWDIFFTDGKPPVLLLLRTSAGLEAADHLPRRCALSRSEAIARLKCYVRARRIEAEERLKEAQAGVEYVGALERAFEKVVAAGEAETVRVVIQCGSERERSADRAD